MGYFVTLGFIVTFFIHASQFQGEESNCTNITFTVRGHTTRAVFIIPVL